MRVAFLMIIMTLMACVPPAAPGRHPSMVRDAGVARQGDWDAGEQVNGDAPPTAGDPPITPGIEGSPLCDSPDALIVLDRTASMHRDPDGAVPPNTASGRAKTKWGLAVDAVNQIVASPADTKIRFGLELFPRNPGDGSCLLLPALMTGALPTNPACVPGEVIVSPQPSAGAAIAGFLTRDATPLCITTPITAAVDTALGALTSTATPAHAQYIVLITDGKETCETNPVEAVARAWQAGIRTHVVGFGAVASGVSVSTLNAMACAGGTAVDFVHACTLSGTTYVPVQPSSTIPLYHDAADGLALVQQLRGVEREVCCGCQLD